MTKVEREVWRNYFETLAQKKHLEEFLSSLKQPDFSQHDALQAYEDVVSGVRSKIFALVTSSALLKKSVADIENKLESPDCKKKYSPRHSSNFTIQSSRKKNVETCKRQS